jgi:RHS repeat-associated protein
VALSGSVTGLVRERWLTHDSQGLLRREEFRLAGAAGTPGNAIVAYDYDAYGNRRTMTDPNGCATTTVFDASQAFPFTRTTCIAGHTTTFAHDVGLGVPTSVTDANGVSLSLSYDPFGRLLKITGPLADTTYGWISYAYGTWGNATAQNIRAYNGVGSWTDDYFDARGRVYTRQRKGPGGVAITTQRVFDARGQVAQQSAPYLPTEPIAWTMYSYDALGRPTLTRYADQTTVSSAYGAAGVTTVTDERGAAKRITRDAWARVTRVVEPTGGQTDYTYDAAGSLLTASDPTGGPATTMTYDRLGRRLTLTDSTLGAWTFLYDTRGNVTDQTDGNSKTIHFTYDAYNRVTGKTYPPGGSSVTWTYDNVAVAYSKGRLTRIQDGTTTTSFVYDAAGRVTQISRLLDATTYVLSQTYDAAGRVASRTFPDTETVTYGVNEAGWPTSMAGSWSGGSRTYVSATAYNGRGQRTSIQYGNGITTTLTYDPVTSRLTGLLTLGPSGALQNLAYAYDAAGNLVQIADSVGSAGRRFAYDAGNRLVTASGWFNGVSEQYAYNASGNLTSRASVIYAYSDPSHPWRLGTVADGRTYTYDGNGNVLTGAGLQLTWDFDNQLQTLIGPGGTESLAYDSQGQRVRKTANADVKRSPFVGYQVDSFGVVKKSLGPVARAAGVVFAYHDDHLGSTHVITDAEGMPLQIVEYTPWGQLSRSEGAADLGARFRTAEAGSPRARYYDPSLGRFLSVDWAIPDPEDPGARNRYSYGRNNPMTLPDMVRPGLKDGL